MRHPASAPGSPRSAVSNLSDLASPAEAPGSASAAAAALPKAAFAAPSSLASDAPQPGSASTATSHVSDSASLAEAARSERAALGLSRIAGGSAGFIELAPTAVLEADEFQALLQAVPGVMKVQQGNHGSAFSVYSELQDLWRPNSAVSTCAASCVRRTLFSRSTSPPSRLVH